MIFQWLNVVRLNDLTVDSTSVRDLTWNIARLCDDTTTDSYRLSDLAIHIF